MGRILQIDTVIVPMRHQAKKNRKGTPSSRRKLFYIKKNFNLYFKRNIVTNSLNIDSAGAGNLQLLA